jgi:hypothetical protein
MVTPSGSSCPWYSANGCDSTDASAVSKLACASSMRSIYELVAWMRTEHVNGRPVLHHKNNQVLRLIEISHAALLDTTVSRHRTIASLDIR